VTATFYKGTDFAGPAAATRTYPQLDVNWNWIAPAPGVDPSNFSARFTGTITPPERGVYRFALERRRCDANAEIERYAIRIDGAAPISVNEKCNSRDSGGGPVAEVRFDDDRPHAFTIDYAHRHKVPGFAPALTFVWSPPEGVLQREALRTAEGADVIVAFVGLNAWLEGEEMDVKVPGFAGGDRTDIALPAAQAELVHALKATGKPVILVLQSGSAVALGDANLANAVLEAWYPGEEGGQAIADVLTGAYNPAGRLPVTFYASAGQLPPFAEYSMKDRTYRYFGGKPEYAFGHGLSYTKFSYSQPKIRRAGKDRIVSVRVTNSGGRPGDEVTQLYLSPPQSGGVPLRSLKGFERIHLDAGETRSVAFRLTPRELAFADAAGVMRTRKGFYHFWLGGGQEGTGAPGAGGALMVTTGEVLAR
jgi:beta-glucosidase